MTSEPLAKVIRSRRRNETGFRDSAFTSSGAAMVLALCGEKKEERGTIPPFLIYDLLS
jgi:hypothetical protein